MAQFNPFAVLRHLWGRLFGRGKRLAGYPDQARTTSMWVIGQPGMGKSKFIESLVMQDIMQGRAVGLIDIHGDLFHHVRDYIAALTLKHPQLVKRVVIVDPTCPEHTVSINPLEAIAGQSQERTALFLTDIVIKIWQISPNESPRLVWLLTNSFLALANLGLTLADFPRWLQDKEWRNSVVPRITHEAVARYWADEFPRSDKEIQQWIAPAANKLGGILFDAEVQHVLTGTSHISMRDVLDQGLILLVHIPKGILGERSAFLLGAFIVAQIQKAALSRANTPQRRQFFCYLDEFQNYTTDYIQDVLAESRKYGLSLVLAHQFLDQLDTKLRSAVINTVGTLVSFRIGYKDARAIVYEVFPTPDFPRYRGDLETGSWEQLALELANLPPRTFWVRRRGPFMPSKQRTLDMPDPDDNPDVQMAVQRLVATSGRLYGAHKPLVTAPASPAALHQSASTNNSATARPPQQPAAAAKPKQETSAHEPNTIFSDIIWDK